MSSTKNQNLPNLTLIGYGKQGRAQALNLRDSGIKIEIAVRNPHSLTAQRAKSDHFDPIPIEEAFQNPLICLLIPDLAISKFYKKYSQQLKQKTLLFSHGYALHFGDINPNPETQHILVAPKCAGEVLREGYLSKEDLVGLYGSYENKSQALTLAISYAEAIGLKKVFPTTFKEETETDLFGEQAVLCGGMIELLKSAHQTLISRGYSSDVAFIETCYEAKKILDLLLLKGPQEFPQSISDMAAFGGQTRGSRVITSETKIELHKILDQIQNRDFSQEVNLSCHEETHNWFSKDFIDSYRSVIQGVSS